MTQGVTRETVVDWLEQLFETSGKAEYLGEPVTQAQHMLQGAKLAEDAGLSEAVVAAALLHDIGHLVDPNDMFTMQDQHDRHHEVSGAAILEPYFPQVVVECIRQHVAAKRYLCATRPSYNERLSAASKHSLMLQGGPMDESEAQAFAENPFLEEIIRVRYLDDAGKRTDLETRTFADYKPLLQRLVDGHCASVN